VSRASRGLWRPHARQPSGVGTGYEALGNSEMFAVQVEDPRWFNSAHTKVTVTVKLPLITSTRTMVYEDGRWVQEPQPATLEVIATFKKSGQAEAVRKHCTE
jgi:hypothetical protein